MALTIREREHLTKRRGTLLSPLPVEVAIGHRAELHSWLGYEGGAQASDFWQFTIPVAANIQVVRRSEDPLVVHVAVALLDRFNRRVCSLVDTADGIGQFHELEAGTYTIVASLGMPLEMPDVRLTVNLEGHWRHLHGRSSTAITVMARSAPFMAGLMLERSAFFGDLNVSLMQSKALSATAIRLGGRLTTTRMTAIADLSWIQGWAHVNRSLAGISILYGIGLGRVSTGDLRRVHRHGGLAISVETASAQARMRPSLRAVMTLISPSTAAVQYANCVDTGGRLKGQMVESAPTEAKARPPGVRASGLSSGGSLSKAAANQSLSLSRVALSYYRPGSSMPPLFPQVKGLSSTAVAATAGSGHVLRRPPGHQADLLQCIGGPYPPQQDLPDVPAGRPCDPTVP